MASASVSLRSAVRGQMLRCRSGTAQALGNSTSATRGLLLSAPMREVQSAKADFVRFQRRVSNPSSYPVPYPT